MYLFVLIIWTMLFLSKQHGRLRLMRTFDITSINCCQFLLAISIVLAHLSQYLKVAWLKPFTTCGGWAVPIFFFISGYGLYYSLTRKKDYLKNFLHKRLGKILMPFVIATALYLILYYTNGENLHGKLFLWKELALFSLPYSWFVLSIIVFYLLFYIAFKLIIKHKQAIGIVFVGVILYEFYRLFTGSNPNTFFAGLCFPLGLLVCKKEKCIEDFLQNIRSKSVFIVLAFLTLLAIFTYDSFGKVYSALIFYLLIRLVPSGINVLHGLKNFILKTKLNTISYEIYLTQGIGFLVLRNNYIYIGSPVLYVLVCVLVILCISGGGLWFPNLLINV